MSRHSWENPGNRSAHDWEDPEESSDEESDLDSDEEETPAKAADELLSILICLKMCGTLSAKAFCTICYWAYKAGLESFSTYGKLKGSKNSARRLRDLLGETDHCE